MTALTYYSPLWLGALVALAIYYTVYGTLLWGGLLAAPLAGLAAQLTLLGFQGAFAQVLPVPWGRSIRGRGAAATGGLTLLAIGIGVAAFLVGVDNLGRIATALFVLAGTCLAIAMGTYIWCMPVAVRDFAAVTERGR